MSLETTIAGEPVRLLADGALAWPARDTLVLADPHFGKDDVFRRAGIAVPRGPTLRDLERVGALLRAEHARRLLIVGDFVHARSERGDDLPRQFALWRQRHPSIEVVLVAGNHDRHEDWTPWRALLDVQFDALVEPPFVFAHDPAADERGYVVGGHIHPVFAAPELGSRKALRVFWQTPRYLVLPSFGEFTGGARIDPAPRDGLYACTPEGVLCLKRPR